MEAKAKVEKLKELSAFVKSVGEHLKDEFVQKSLPELIDGHARNVETKSIQEGQA